MSVFNFCQFRPECSKMHSIFAKYSDMCEKKIVGKLSQCSSDPCIQAAASVAGQATVRPWLQPLVPNNQTSIVKAM